ncbi:MAG: hypothetical protein KDD51_01220 [Bdellovibrionales bacterium]|nr:hypothetical protein [Bdellovibrionales bacterium]
MLNENFAIKLARDFWGGLRCMHWAPPVVAGFLFVLSLAFLEYGFRAGTYSRIPLGYLLKDSKDLFMYTNHTLPTLKQNPPKTLQIYSVGGSSMAYAFKEEEFRSLLHAHLRQEVSFHNFASGMQPLHESVAIIDQLPSYSGLVLLGVNPRIMSRELSEDRERWRLHHLLLYSPTRNQLLEEDGIEESFLFPHIIWRLKHQLWVHRGQYLRGHLPCYEYEPSWFDREPHTAEKKAWKIKKYAQRNRNYYAARIQSNLHALRALVNLCRRKSLGLVLVELPLNQVAREAMGAEFMATYSNDMRAVARALDVAYWDYSKLSIRQGDFYDANHVMKPARLQIERATAEALSQCQSRPLYRLPGVSSGELFPPRVDCYLGDLG